MPSRKPHQVPARQPQSLGFPSGERSQKFCNFLLLPSKLTAQLSEKSEIGTEPKVCAVGKRLLCHIARPEKTSVDTPGNSRMLTGSVCSWNRGNLAASPATPIFNKGSVTDLPQAPRWEPQRVRIYLENINVGVWPKRSCGEVHLSERENERAEVAEAPNECQTPYLVLTVPSFLP